MHAVARTLEGSRVPIGESASAKESGGGGREGGQAEKNSGGGGEWKEGRGNGRREASAEEGGRRSPIGVDKREPIQQAIGKTEELHGLLRAIDELEAYTQQLRGRHLFIQRRLEHITRELIRLCIGFRV